MSRFALLLLAPFAVSPAVAQTSLYRVTLAAPVTSAPIVKDIKWSCAGASCTAPRTGTSPDGTICTAVVRKLGPIAAFAAGDTLFDPDQIRRCNAAARRTKAESER